MLESPHDVETVHCVKLTGVGKAESAYSTWKPLRTWTQEAVLSSPKIERRIPTDEKR